MLLWLIAVILLICVGIVGYYQGAIRAGFSLVGLVLAAVLARPLAGTVGWILPPLGISHPVTIAFVAPAVVYLIVLIAFKVAGHLTHKKVESWFKSRFSDTERSLFDRLNHRWGVSLGLANATVYFFLICVLVGVLGYGSTQIATGAKDSTMLRWLNGLEDDLQSTGMAKAIAPFNPAPDVYYDRCDVVGDVFHNPLLQSRLGSYPVFLPLTENAEFKSIANDLKFQETWQAGLSVAEFTENEKIKTLVNNVDLYTNVIRMLGEDTKDLKAYLETGVSPKYDDLKILGHWEFDYPDSMARAMKIKARLGSAEVRKLKLKLGVEWGKSKFSAFLDNQAILKLGATNSAALTYKGTWKGEGSQYTIRMKGGALNVDVNGTVEGGKLLVNDATGLVLVFAK